MISWLIDATILGALAVTSWRTTRMVGELRRLRREESNFAKALADADAAINRAAHAVVMLKSEGVATLAALEARIADATRVCERMEDAAHLAALDLELANDNAFAFEAAPVAEPVVASGLPGAEWVRRIESRLAPASTLNR